MWSKEIETKNYLEKILRSLPEVEKIYVAIPDTVRIKDMT